MPTQVIDPLGSSQLVIRASDSLARSTRFHSQFLVSSPIGAVRGGFGSSVENPTLPPGFEETTPKFPYILQLFRSQVRVVEHLSLRKIPGTISSQLWWRRREALCDSGFRTCSCVKFQDHIRASGGGRPVLQILKGRGNLNRSCRIEDHGQGRRD